MTSLYLLYGLEPKGVRLELVREALGPGAELLGDVPHAGGELCQDTCSESEGNVRPCHLLPVEGLHGCEGRALAGVQLVARDQGGGQAQDEDQQRRHGGDRGEM